MVELTTLETVFVSFLIFGIGYTILFLSFKKSKRTKIFYNINSFDKTMQSLILGFIMFIISSLTLKISFFSVENIFSSFFDILIIESFYGYLLVSIISDNINLIIK